MVIDSHTHIFQHWAGGACGHGTRGVHMNYLRKIGTGPAGKIFRRSDGAEMASSGLFRNRDFTWKGFVDANFWVGQFGQLNFTLEGEDYYIQYMPVASLDAITSAPTAWIFRRLPRGRRNAGAAWAG